MKDLDKDIRARADFIKKMLAESKASGIVFGNSGGKDSALVGILSKMATQNVLGVIMPCGTSRNYGMDKDDALKVAAKFNIECITVDLGGVKNELHSAVDKSVKLNEAAAANIAPRLRMATLYSIARTKNMLVAGTGNRSEAYMGYFTKWGDGAYDINPIADLTVTEIYEMLKYLGAPQEIITKAPSAGLYEGQTDENEMGVSYSAIDSYILTGSTDPKSKEIIDRAHKASAHKRAAPVNYSK